MHVFMSQNAAGFVVRALSENDRERLTPLFPALEKIKFGLKIEPNAWRICCILYHKTNKEASTVLCSVVKHLGSGRALKK